MSTREPSLGADVYASVRTKGRRGFRRLLSFVGPAYLVSVGYMDPGNWATDIAGGSRFGYSLLWVLLVSNIAAVFLQSLCVRLGVVHGRDLAQANRETYPRVLNFMLYLLAEIAIIATDLAEVLGMAIGINLLTGIPLLYGVLITLLDTFLLLYLQRLGIRKMEAFIIAMIAIILVSFVIQNIMVTPDVLDVAEGFIPRIENDEALYIAIGIIGATVMPHNLYLHSALVQTRQIEKTDKGIRTALRLNFIDSTIALNLAFLVNAGILMLAAGAFHKAGLFEVSEIKDAYELLVPLLGSSLAPILFAVALIAAGQSSTITGTLAGQIIMEGYLGWRVNPIIRRLISRLLAVVPAFFVILIMGDKHVDKLLIFSQVILSLQLAFAIIPLVRFVSDKEKMHKFVLPYWKQLIAWLIIVLLLVLNIKMVSAELSHIWTDYPTWWARAGLFLLLAGLAVLLVVLLAYPLFKNRLHFQRVPALMHKMRDVQDIRLVSKLPDYKVIAVSLDFGGSDEQVLSHALRHASKGTRFVLIHVVESATAIFMGEKSDDYETQNDKKLLTRYAQTIENEGYACKPILAFSRRAQAIARVIQKERADLLVVGSHGHTSKEKLIFGQTIDELRTYIDIPLFIVST